MFKTENLYQNDDAWGSKKLGNSNETIKGWGCLLTSVTMMLNGIGYDETPATVNDKMKAKGGFQGAFFIPSVLPYAFPNLVYKDMEPCENFPAPISRIDAAVAAGKPVILQVDWNKKAGVQTHFVLVKEKKGDDYIIYDPYKYGGDGPGKDVLLTQRYKYQGQKLESEISAVLWFDAYGIPPKPPKPKTPVALPADSMSVFVAEDDLAFRADPSVGGYLVKRLEGETELKSLESAEATKKKLGVMGQWLHAQDPEGKQAYTAAWYLSEKKGAPPPGDTTVVSSTSTTSTAATPPSTKPLPAGALSLIPTDNIAFRKNTTISPDTLIRRIPTTEKVVSLEPSDQTIKKVGVMGQWLNVRDKDGRDGFVAAWYVKYESGATAAAAEATTPPSAGGANTVKTTAQGVSFRSQSKISSATLIRHLPVGESLTIAEAGGEAKIGSNNQWLKVKDASGVEGYVAAWFVAR
ncbi:MAG: hypothetical protein HN390_14295 [Anaerolineae bacterium]|jgi:hypothetical protein|nr:hypothetical protein [Anaerolineae bacterium]MBT7190309.1 hypothetical protein [Anaerolineae bacterium]MBT7990272.1 hypothetical protein [Anaerolineae bacterium]